jgi:hypothetical protein
MAGTALVLRAVTPPFRLLLASAAVVALITLVIGGALQLGHQFNSMLLEQARRNTLDLGWYCLTPDYLDASITQAYPADTVAPLVWLPGAAETATSDISVPVQILAGDATLAQVTLPAPPEQQAWVHPILLQRLGLKAGQEILLTVTRPDQLPQHVLMATRRDQKRLLTLRVQAMEYTTLPAQCDLGPQGGGLLVVINRATLVQAGWDAMRINMLAATKPPARSATAVDLATFGLQLRPRPEHGDTLLIGHDFALPKLPFGDFVLTPRVLYVADRVATGTGAEISYATIGSETKARGWWLTPWTAEALRAQVGQPLTVTLLRPDATGQFIASTHTLPVERILTPAEWRPDRDYAPALPGLTDATNITDWDVPFPLEAQRITPADEAYWDTYRASPKLWAPPALLQTLLLPAQAPPEATLYSSATSTRTDEASLVRQIADERCTQLETQGVQPQLQLAQRATTAMNFTALLVALSIPLLLALSLLLWSLLQLTIRRLAPHIALLRTLGFSLWRCRMLTLLALQPMLLIGIACGLAFTLGYQNILGQFFLIVGGRSLLGITSGSMMIWPAQGLNGMSVWVGVGMALTANLMLLRQICALGSRPEVAALRQKSELHAPRRLSRWLPGQLSSLPQLALRNMTAGIWQGLGIFTSMLFALLLVTALLLHIQRSATPASATAGLFNGQYRVITQLDLPARWRDPQQRTELLADFPELQTLRLQSLLLGPGQSTDCTTALRPPQPRLLGIPDAWFAQLAPQAVALPAGVVACIADSQTLQWTLHTALGGILPDSAPRPLQVVATTENTIWSGELLVRESDLLAMYPQASSQRYWLVDAPPGQSAALARLWARYGPQVETTEDLLARVLAAQKVYMYVLLLLGGLGVIMGTLGWMALIWRNVAARQSELALLRALGFSGQRILVMLLWEYGTPLLGGVILGTALGVLVGLPVLSTPTALWPPMILAVVLVAGNLVGLSFLLGLHLRGPLLTALRRE